MFCFWSWHDKCSILRVSSPHSFLLLTSQHWLFSLCSSFPFPILSTPFKVLLLLPVISLVSLSDSVPVTIRSIFVRVAFTPNSISGNERSPRTSKDADFQVSQEAFYRQVNMERKICWQQSCIWEIVHEQRKISALHSTSPLCYLEKSKHRQSEGSGRLYLMLIMGLETPACIAVKLFSSWPFSSTSFYFCKLFKCVHIPQTNSLCF